MSLAALVDFQTKSRQADATGGASLSPDMEFDKEIRTPGVII